MNQEYFRKLEIWLKNNNIRVVNCGESTKIIYEDSPSHVFYCDINKGFIYDSENKKETNIEYIPKIISKTKIYSIGYGDEYLTYECSKEVFDYIYNLDYKNWINFKVAQDYFIEFKKDKNLKVFY